MKKPILSVFLAVVLMFGAFPGLQVGAEAYQSYIYDSYGRSLVSAANYEVETVLTGRQLGTTNLSAPTDIFVDDQTDTLYVLDSGNGRVLILDATLTLKGELSTFTDKGVAVSLNSPTSLFVRKNGELLIADAGNERILISSPTGEIRQIITCPDDEQYPSNIRFAPQRIVADEQGNIYAIITGLYEGAALFNADGEFQRFFGSNEISISARLLWDYFWKQIMSDEQKSALSRYVPVEFTSFDIDSDGFIYTVTQTDQNSDMLRKLNFLGNSVIYDQRKFGDLETEYDQRSIITRFCDVCVDLSGNTFALDLTRGHIFQYNTDFNLVGVFGSSSGAQEGTFQLPCAIETMGDQVIVLDSSMGTLTVFSPTEFGEKVLAALELYRGGYYLEAVDAWEDILAGNENYFLAYQGIADGQYMRGQYREAMENYRLAGNRSGYLKAFREYRNIRLRESFLLIFVMVVLLLGGVVVLIKRAERKRRLAPAIGIVATKEPKRLLYPLRVLTHPIDSFETMKVKKLFSPLASLFILALFFFSSVFSYLYTGFGYNENDPHKMNVLVQLAITVGVFILWVISNYLFCTLLNGKGFFKEIWCASAYALLPHVLLTYFVTFVSNFVVTEEYTLVSYIGTIGVVWSAALLVLALKTVHDYSIGQTIACMLLTLLGVLIAVFLLVLSFTVYNEVFSMFSSIARELLFRL